MKFFAHVVPFVDDHSKQSNLLNIKFITWSISVECISHMRLALCSAIQGCMRYRALGMEVLEI